VHGIPGIVGALSIGFFGTKVVNPAGANGVFYGGDGRQLWVQLVAILITIVWTAVVTFPIIFLFKRMDWFSLQPHHEHLGLDVKDHQTHAYKELENEFEDGAVEKMSSKGVAAHQSRLRTHPRQMGANPTYKESTGGLLDNVNSINDQ
jgi:hypothetical protein